MVLISLLPNSSLAFDLNIFFRHQIQCNYQPTNITNDSRECRHGWVPHHGSTGLSTPWIIEKHTQITIRSTKYLLYYFQYEHISNFWNQYMRLKHYCLYCSWMTHQTSCIIYSSNQWLYILKYLILSTFGVLFADCGGYYLGVRYTLLYHCWSTQSVKLWSLTFVLRRTSRNSLSIGL